MLHRILIVTAVTAAALGCSERAPVTAPPEASVAALASQRPERLARLFARALRNPAFRAYVKAQLDASPFAEHKVQFQTFLGANGARAARHLAEASGAGEADVAREAAAAIALEAYLPVPAHRAAWTGDENVLVATAITDRERPVAFDTRGGRRLLDAETPPATPVIALVPVETDFAPPAQRLEICLFCGDTGSTPPPPPPPPSGLYMTKAHFVQDFEGWLKGAPEFEVHILGQKGQTDSLQSYQCAGERQAAPYFFNQDNLDWTGSALLFSKTQLDGYNVAHPGQNVRVFVVEDDDTSCEIKTDPDRFKNLILAVDAANQKLTAGNDSSSTVAKVWKYAQVFYKLFQALASWLKSNDELVGNAVQDVIAGQAPPGYNWIVKGDNNATNGWIKLAMQ
jgi:hypothetical protein